MGKSLKLYERIGMLGKRK